jgi:hypothetical protein
VTDTQRIETLRSLGEELRATLAEERKAIARLDHERLEWLAEQKRRVAQQLADARTGAPLPMSPDLKNLFEALRVEVRATAMLARTAAEAVRGLLGVESTGGYDRYAKKTSTTGPVRILTAY